MLFPYFGLSLEREIFEVDGKEALLVARKTLELFVEMHRVPIYHSDIKPANILRNGNEFKAIDFGVSQAFESMPKLAESVKSAKLGFRGWTRRYIPPENLRNLKHYKREKFDVYCWAMTIYQYVSRKSHYELEKQADELKVKPELYDYF